MNKILSDVYLMKKNINIDTAQIEKELHQKFGDVIRWAIIESTDNDIKISVSYRCNA